MDWSAPGRNCLSTAIFWFPFPLARKVNKLFLEGITRRSLGELPLRILFHCLATASGINFSNLTSPEKMEPLQQR